MAKPSSPSSDATQGISPAGKEGLARGASMAMIARTGAVIEVVAQPLYIWLFGLPVYGLFVMLWAAMSLVSKLVDLSMPNALQRLIPGEQDSARAHGVLRIALLVAIIPTSLIAIGVQLNAAYIAALLARTGAYAPDAASVALFAWTLPLWTFVEITTSAVRAKGAFGPEIRLRIFWEQIARILFALMFYAAGLFKSGLILAHLCSLGVITLLCLRLLSRHYDLRLIWQAPRKAAPVAPTLLTGIALAPAALARRLLIDGPPILLVSLMPAGGPIAAGLFEVARKISTVPQIVRQAFLYVIAPMATAQARADRTQLNLLYCFTTRLTTALVIPLGSFIAFAGVDILSIYRPETIAALPALYILTATRVLDALAGPSSAIVEMVGHRLLPLLNNFAGVVVWLGIAFICTPQGGLIAMALAVAAGTLVIGWLSAAQLHFTEKITLFDRQLMAGLIIGLIGFALMWLIILQFGGPVRFAMLVLIWLGVSWLGLRFGLTHDDRCALGTVAQKLRLI